MKLAGVGAVDVETLVEAHCEAAGILVERDAESGGAVRIGEGRTGIHREASVGLLEAVEAEVGEEMRR